MTANKSCCPNHYTLNTLNFMNKFFITSFSIALLLFSSCKKDNDNSIAGPGSADINFDAVVGGEDLTLNKDFNINNRIYNFKTFRYWVSNVQLLRSSGTPYAVPNAYYLLEEIGDLAIQDGDFTYPAKKREKVTLTGVPIGDYTGITFSIGIDQKYNDNLSLQAGELSQLNGMTNISWMWHTTYIFSAISGTVKESADLKNLKVETGLNANFKTVTLNFPKAILINGSKSTTIDLKADIAKVFEGVDVYANPEIGASKPTEMATIANNYGTSVFSVKAAQ